MGSSSVVSLLSDGGGGGTGRSFGFSILTLGFLSGVIGLPESPARFLLPPSLLSPFLFLVGNPSLAPVRAIGGSPNSSEVGGVDSLGDGGCAKRCSSLGDVGGVDSLGDGG